ncbi:MAG: hypothetical protein LBQ61_01150 [Spirochaetales bacterium]|jgi:hypothetical protein|nr:hypothetical protein [Spirochaetales bacterium]
MKKGLLTKGLPAAAGLFLLGIGSCSTFGLKDAALLLSDIPRYNGTEYINRDTLSPDYFEAAGQTLDDPHIYLIFSDTGSPGSKLISLFTKDLYNHVSLAFDEALATMVSYNGGNGRNNPGLNQERLEDFYQKADAAVAVYKLASSREQKEIIINRIRQINERGSGYNLIGILTRQNYRPNIMVCSHFVYTMLNAAGLLYFYKEGAEVKPMDFLRQNQGNLALVHQIRVRDTLAGSGRIL